MERDATSLCHKPLIELCKTGTSINNNRNNQAVKGDMMKLKALLMTVLLTVGAAAVEAANGRVYLGLDVFTVANAADKWEENTGDAVDLLVDYVGYDSAGYEMTTSAGLGARLGLTFPIADTEYAAWGASIGYVKGPASDIDVHAESTLTTQGVYNEQIETSYVRVLFELSKGFPIGSRSDDKQSRFTIGAGLGAAYGKMESETTARGSFVTVLGAPSSQSDSKTWTGLTWEITPSVIIPSGTTEIEIGARFAGFPKLKESDDYSEFKWNPFGVFCALHF